jgi:fermentation-respiration switch protein FrsA (DUF1100 family)
MGRGNLARDLTPRDRTGLARLRMSVVVVFILAACSHAATPEPGSSTGPGSPSPVPTDSSPSAAVIAPALDCDGTAGARAIWFPAADGTRLYGALLGSGRVGVVVANDVPHDPCETLTPAKFLAARGYRVLMFDYRDRGLSDLSDAPGRLDLDVAGAVSELRSRGTTKVILLGSYAGAAAVVVAGTEVRPYIDGVIGISPAPVRGQWVDNSGSGPFGPTGAFEAARRLGVPTLYVTVRSDSYVSFGSVRRLYRLTASPDKELVIIPSGSTGFDTIDFNSYSGRVRTAILSFVRRVVA